MVVNSFEQKDEHNTERERKKSKKEATPTEVVIVYNFVK